MVRTYTLQMTFQNAEGGKVNVNVSNVKDTLTSQEVGDAMDVIIAQNVLISSGGDLVKKVTAQLIDRAVSQII